MHSAVPIAPAPKCSAKQSPRNLAPFLGKERRFGIDLGTLTCNSCKRVSKKSQFLLVNFNLGKFNMINCFRNPMDDTVFLVGYGVQYPCATEVLQGEPGSALELIV